MDKALSHTTGRKDIGIAAHARRSLFAYRDIKKGEVLDRSMIQVVRPGDGLSPEMLDFIIGKVVKVDIKR